MTLGVARVGQPTPSTKEYERSAAAAQGRYSALEVGSYTAAGLRHVVQRQRAVQIEMLKTTQAPQRQSKKGPGSAASSDDNDGDEGKDQTDEAYRGIYRLRKKDEDQLEQLLADYAQQLHREHGN